MTRALVVDDSQFMRTVVGNTLSDDGFDVVEASNGEEAVAAVENHDVDVVTMDVAMPEMDGLEATERIMERRPTPILMVSAHTEAGADDTLDALEKGAVDFMTKPGGEVSIETEEIEAYLVERVEAVVGADLGALDPIESPSPAAAEAAGSGDGETMTVSAGAAEPGVDTGPTTAGDISAIIEERVAEEYVENPTVVLGASTGGPKLISAVMAELPRALDARVLVVQHMPEE